MSRQGRPYGKRGGGAPITSIQFDKLIAEASKRPIAAKSAGVIGKWGTASFTSLRSSQVNGEKAGKLGLSKPALKRPIADVINSPVGAPPVATQTKDSFSFDSLDTSTASQPKPKKFFKSRGTEDPGKQLAPAASILPITSTQDTSNTAYSPPTFRSNTYQAVSPGKRGRGRPRGSRGGVSRGSGHSPVGKAAAVSSRGLPRKRGRPPGVRGARGAAVAGRGKKKKQPWDDSDSEEEQESAEEDELYETNIAPEEEVNEEEEEELDEQEPDEPVPEKDSPGTTEECKRPIKLRLIRRSDSDGFVSQVEEVKQQVETIGSSSPPPSPTPPQKEEPTTQGSPTDTQPPEEEPEGMAEQEEALPEDPVVPALPEEIVTVEQKLAALTGEVEEPYTGSSSLPIILSEETKPEEEQLSSSQPSALPKKTNIFKSRSTSAPNSQEQAAAKSGKKGLALYRHKWHSDVQKTPGPSTADSAQRAGQGEPSPWDLDEPDDKPPADKATAQLGRGSMRSHLTKLSEENAEEESESASNLKCPRKLKDYYTVVRNVKKAHQIQESGEFQEFNDDVDYILDALQSQNSAATRCLSAVSLAAKCMAPAFRMHLRAHSTVAKFFKALTDAPSKPSVALCTSCIMFVLTQDRLNMDLDRDSLELMLNLLEADSGGASDPADAKELEKNRQKVRELCEEMVRKGHAPHLNLDNITAAQLAMETLLSLTSKKAGEWFKEELRELGGLDHIIQTITQCTRDIVETCLPGNFQWDRQRIDALKKADRCLRVLENVTFQNEENQSYLMHYSDGVLVKALLSLQEVFVNEVIIYSPVRGANPTGVLVSEALCTLMKVLMNLTHDYSYDSKGSQVFGEIPKMWSTTFTCLLEIPQHLPEEKRFDIMALSMGIFINLVERCVENRDRLLTARVPGKESDLFDGAESSAIQALIDLFAAKQESARLEEARTDAILDGKAPANDVSNISTMAFPGLSESSTSSNANKPQEDPAEDTVKKLLHKAGRHMEDSMIAAYVGLLIGYVVMENKSHEKTVKGMLPNRKFSAMVAVLKKFYEFLKLTANAVTSSKGLKNTELVIKFMEASDARDSSVNVKREREDDC